MNKTFKDFNLKPFLNEALTEIDFKTPTEVQQRLIPVIKKGKIMRIMHIQSI